jgi:chaperone required for assembly of F1-ATPase
LKLGVVQSKGGFKIALENRMLQTPAGAEFWMPNRELAEAIAEEWRAEGGFFKPSTMPLSRLAYAAIDQVTSDPAPAMDELMGYAGTDLVCYRAEGPESLVERQEALWQPLLDDLALRHGVLLSVHHGVIPRRQPEAALVKLRRLASPRETFALAGLAAAVRACGSFVIGLALSEGALTPEQAFDVSQLDETYQIEKWGEDPETSLRRRALLQEISEIDRFLRLAR